MPRKGQNPAKKIEKVAKPERVTVALITYIPFLHGYYQHSLDVLEVCLDSILANTTFPYDVLVFDNASCPEVCGCAPNPASGRGDRLPASLWQEPRQSRSMEYDFSGCAGRADRLC